MSVRTSGSVDNDRDPESLYGDASVADRDYPILNSNVDDNQRTPSPGAEDDNQDPNYTPTRQPTASAASTVFTTPSQRSNLGEFSSVTRQALDKLYTLVYGENSRRCILTQVPTPLNAAHVVQRATKSHQLTLYEYCLGCDFRTFHVDSRRNLVYLDTSWHTKFDEHRWLLLPAMAVLTEVLKFVMGVMASRKNPSGRKILGFRSKWGLLLKTSYTLIPLPELVPMPFFRQNSNPADWGEPYYYPYNRFPPLECHVSPALMVINAGPKLAGLDLDAIALNYHQQQPNDSQKVLKQRLELVCEIWSLFENAKDDAEKWEAEIMRQKGLKRPRDDVDDIENLSQSSKRTTRSQSNSGKKRDVAGGPSGSAKARSESKRTSGGRKRKWASSSSAATLTEDAVFHLGKRQKTTDLIQHWVESARASTGINDSIA